MTLFEELTPAQEKIIREICYMQLSSLRRIYTNNSLSDIDLTMLLIKEEVAKEDFIQILEIRMENMKRVGRTPKEINSLKPIDLSIFRHILFQIEEKYQAKFPKAISNLWSRLHILEDFHQFNSN